MVRIVDPELHVEPRPGHRGDRRVVVTYHLVVDADDPVIGAPVEERVVVEPVDEHDAPVRPTSFSMSVRHRIVPTSAGTTVRHLSSDVHRVDLDVEQDWWRTDTGGGTEPIAEFLDHLAATVTLHADGEELARAVTPVVTGSWGALGDD